MLSAQDCTDITRFYWCGVFQRKILLPLNEALQILVLVDLHFFSDAAVSIARLKFELAPL